MRGVVRQHIQRRYRAAHIFANVLALAYHKYYYIPFEHVIVAYLVHLVVNEQRANGPVVSKRLSEGGVDQAHVSKNRVCAFTAQLRMVHRCNRIYAKCVRIP